MWQKRLGRKGLANVFPWIVEFTWKQWPTLRGFQPSPTRLRFREKCENGRERKYNIMILLSNLLCAFSQNEQSTPWIIFAWYWKYTNGKHTRCEILLDFKKQWVSNGTSISLSWVDTTQLIQLKLFLYHCHIFYRTLQILKPKLQTLNPSALQFCN